MPKNAYFVVMLGCRFVQNTNLWRHKLANNRQKCGGVLDTIFGILRRTTGFRRLKRRQTPRLWNCSPLPLLLLPDMLPLIVDTLCTVLLNLITRIRAPGHAPPAAASRAHHGAVLGVGRASDPRRGLHRLCPSPRPAPAPG